MSDPLPVPDPPGLPAQDYAVVVETPITQLLQWLREQDVDLAVVAEDIGVSPWTMYRWATGRTREPSGAAQKALDAWVRVWWHGDPADLPHRLFT